MVGLGTHSPGGGTLQRSVLLERFVVLFHVPSCTIDCSDLLMGELDIRTDQILGDLAAVIVYEELFAQQEGELYPFKVDHPYLTCTLLQWHCVHAHIPALPFVRLSESHFAVTLQGHDELSLQLSFDQAHILCRGIPHVREHVTELDLIVVSLPEQCLIMFVLADGRASLGLAVLLVHVPLGLGYQPEAHRERYFQLRHMVQQGEEVDAFDHAVLGMVIVPGDDVVLVCVWLLRDRVVHDHAPISMFNGPYMGLEDLPQVGAGEFSLREEALNAVMADTLPQQGTETCACGWAEGADQIVRVQVEQFFVLHDFSLSDLAA